LKAKNPKYLKRTIGIIIRWDKKKYDENIIHIHGDNDHTLPIRRIKYNHLIQDGSHMMALIKGKVINILVGEILGYSE